MLLPSRGDRGADMLSQLAELLCFFARFRAKLGDFGVSGRELEGAIERRNRLKARLDALVVNPGLKAAEQRVRDLAERAIHVSKARSDRANRQREIDDGEAQLAALRRMLGLPADADLAPLIPDQSALNLVRSAADEMVERRPGLASARKRLGELAASLAAIDDRLEAARLAGHDAPPEASSSAFASLAAQKSAHQARQQALDNDSASLSGRLKALGIDTIDALATLPCPVTLITDLDYRVWPDIGDPAAIDVALVWLPPPGMLASLHALILALAGCRVPVLVAVRGQCLGGGLEIALAGGPIFAAPNAQFGQPEIKLGVFAPAASCLLPWRVNAVAAEDLLCSGRSIDAAQALAIGLVQMLADDPVAAALAYFDEHLAPRSAAALAHAMQAVRAPRLAALRDELARVERLYLQSLMKTRDANEGLAAFLAKRSPTWEHR